MSEHRFDDDEIREILARATEVRAETPALPAPPTVGRGPGQGLTLAELQEVAGEAGIPAGRIAEAAAALQVDRAALPAPRTRLGVPVSTAHVVRLPRMLDPDEWDRFVVRLRDTFDVAGEVRTEGSLQTWSHGTLQVLLEPLDDGARLRFQSADADARGALEGAVAMGVSGLLLTAFLGGLTLLTGKPVPIALLGVTAGLPAAGAGLWALGRSMAARRLPERRARFGALGEEALRVVVEGGRRIGPDDR